mgnify:FL=1
MNERLRELAQGLGYNVNIKPSDDETDRGYQVVSNDFAEKFAELIVRECISKIEEAAEYSPELYGVALDLQEHFGVE